MKKPITNDKREMVVIYYNEVMLEVSRINATTARVLEKATRMKQILDEDYLIELENEEEETFNS